MVSVFSPGKETGANGTCGPVVLGASAVGVGGGQAGTWGRLGASLSRWLRFVREGWGCRRGRREDRECL